jgi:hypothetical protein
VADDDAETQALIDEAMRKAGLLWLRWTNRPDAAGSAATAERAFWYAWVDGVCYLLTGAEEQPDPGCADGQSVDVVVPSKDDRHLLVTYTATVTRLQPQDPDWAAATAELAKNRLNLPNPSDAPTRWQDPAYALYRLQPTGIVRERPGSYADDAHRQPPVDSPATTQGRRPRILHRRGHSGRPLS